MLFHQKPVARLMVKAGGSTSGVFSGLGCRIKKEQTRVQDKVEGLG